MSEPWQDRLKAVADNIDGRNMIAAVAWVYADFPHPDFTFRADLRHAAGATLPAVSESTVRPAQRSEPLNPPANEGRAS